MSDKIPYKIYLEESEMPRQWYNVRADMKSGNDEAGHGGGACTDFL